MGDRGRQFDMAHALAADLGQGHLDAAFLADDAAVLHPLVLAAQALVVLDRAEDAGAEQPVALRLEGSVVDRFRLLDLAVGPESDLLGLAIEIRILSNEAEGLFGLAEKFINSFMR